MNKGKIIATSLIVTFAIPTQIRAENINHLSQLLNTNQCQYCDLTNAGLVTSNLVGADLTGANLVGANLSRANLTGANLTSTDLRNAYLVNANFQDSNLASAHVQGAIGIAENAATAEQFYAWGVAEDEKGNYPAAIKYYNQAIELDAELAHAYLGRAIIKSRYGNMVNAIEDGEKAQELFEAQNNPEGYALSTRFVQLAQARSDYEANDGEQGNPQFVQIVNSVAPLLFKLFVPYF